LKPRRIKAAKASLKVAGINPAPTKVNHRVEARAKLNFTKSDQMIMEPTNFNVS